VSDWSQFSGFTYYTNATTDQDAEREKKGRARVSTLELEEIVKSLGLNRGSGGVTAEELDVDPEKYKRAEERESKEGVACTKEMHEAGICRKGEKREGAERTEKGTTVRDKDDEGYDKEAGDDSGDSVSLQSEADSSEITVSRFRA
jgi:hypothetical protein